MSQFFVETGNAVNLTATNDVTTHDCSLLGFYINSTSSGIIQLRQGGSGGTVLGGQITPAIGYHPYPANCGSGLHFTLVSGTINVTFFVVQGSA